MGINQRQCEAHGGSSDQHGQNMGFRPWEGEKIEPVHVPIAYIYIYIDTYIGSKCGLKL